MTHSIVESPVRNSAVRNSAVRNSLIRNGLAGTSLAIHPVLDSAEMHAPVATVPAQVPAVSKCPFSRLAAAQGLVKVGKEVSRPAPTAVAVRPAPVLERGLPVLGLLPSMLRNAPQTLLEAAQRHPGEVFAVKLGPMALPVISEPEHVQEVLVDNAKDFIKAGMWEATRPLLGNGLVTSDGDFWRRQRRLVQPLFTQKHLAGMSQFMVHAIDAQLQLLSASAGRAVDVGAQMTLVTQRVLMETVFGGGFTAAEAERLGEHLNIGFKTMNYRTFLYFLPEWIPRPGGRAFFRSVKALDVALMGLLNRRRAAPTEDMDILNQFLAAQDADTGEQMSDRQIRDELMTLFAAGLDTTAVTLTWLLWLLETHPEVDARVRAEVGSVLGDRLPELADLSRLTYTKQVIQESMRLYPPAWMFPRYTQTGTVVGGKAIAPGSSLLVCPYVTHRNPVYWKDADRFLPERFSPEQSEGRVKGAFIPFGMGPRQCLGNHFAMMEAQFAVAMLVQRFRPRLVPGQRIEPSSAGTLHPRHGIQMRFERV